MPSPTYENVILDLHTYQVFDPYLVTIPYNLHLNITCSVHMIKTTNQTLPVITGEWSVAYKEDSDNAWLEPFPSIFPLIHHVHSVRCNTKGVYDSLWTCTDESV